MKRTRIFMIHGSKRKERGTHSSQSRLKFICIHRNKESKEGLLGKRGKSGVKWVGWKYG